MQIKVDLSSMGLALALGFPLMWSLMWHLLRKFHVGSALWMRMALGAAWVVLGIELRANGVNPHIPGSWEVFLFPIVPFLMAERYGGGDPAFGLLEGITPHSASSIVSASGDYAAFGLVVGCAIVMECVLMHRFLWQQVAEAIEEGPDEIEDVYQKLPAKSEG